MTNPITIEDLLSDLRNRIEYEIERHHEFTSRGLASDLVQVLNSEDPTFLSTVASRLIENEVMRQVDNIARDKRTKALHRVRREAAAQKKMKLLVAVGEAVATEDDLERRHDAVISATRNLWNQSVTVSKNHRIRLQACTVEDLEFLANGLTTRAHSFYRNAIFYNFLRKLVIDNNVNTVGDLPEEALEVAASKLESEEVITDAGE